jgi:hypothetical protein
VFLYFLLRSAFPIVSFFLRPSWIADSTVTVCSFISTRLFNSIIQRAPAKRMEERVRNGGHRTAGC